MEPLQEKKLRVLIAKPGLDGHDRGAKVVAHALREAGMEVIYTGLHQSVDAIVAIALQEDVDFIGLSILSGAHLPITQTLMEKLKASNMQDVGIVVGGNIPYKDRQKLLEMGALAVFPTGSPFEEIVAFFKTRMLGHVQTRSAGCS